MNSNKAIQMNHNSDWTLSLTVSFFLLFICGTALTVSAQELDVNLDELINGQTHKVDVLLYSNLSFIQQTGNENTVTTFQEQQGIISNFVDVQQLNHGNNAYIEQTGSGHGTLLLQDGVNNEANLWSAGNLTVSMVKQEGDGNLINSYIDNRKLFPKEAVLLQDGYNNKIDFALLGNGFLSNSYPRAAYISQTGNDLEVNAVFDSFESPVYIEQQSGPGGEGMKVDVSTADFNFPMKR